MSLPNEMITLDYLLKLTLLEIELEIVNLVEFANLQPVFGN